MPRLAHQTPKYRKHSSGQAFVELNGRRHYLGPHGTKASKREYDRVLAEWLALNRSPAFGTKAEVLTIAEMLAAYKAHARNYYGDGPRGEIVNMKRAARLVREMYAKLPAAQFGSQQFKGIRQKLITAGLTRTGINGTMKRVVRMFRWAASEGMIEPAIPQMLAMIPSLRRGKCDVRESQPVKPVDSAIVEATLPFLSPVVAAMVQLQRLTGARPGEIVGIRPCDVDPSTGDVWEARIVNHKTAHLGRSRTIYLGPKAQAVLTPFLMRDSESYCFAPAEAEQMRRESLTANRVTPLKYGNVIGSNRVRTPKRQPGDQYDTQSYGVAISRACQRMHPHPTLGVVKDMKKLTKAQRKALNEWNKKHRWTPNQLRHLVATEIRRGFDLDGAKTVLGHSQVGTTEIYAERDRLRAMEIMRRIG